MATSCGGARSSWLDVHTCSVDVVNSPYDPGSCVPFCRMFQGQPGLIKPPANKEGEEDGSEGASGGAGGGEKRKRRKRRKKYDFSDDLAAREEDEKRLAQEASYTHLLLGRT